MLDFANLVGCESVDDGVHLEGVVFVFGLWLDYGVHLCELTNM